MDLQEAHKILEMSFPGQGVVVRDRPGNVGAYVIERAASVEGVDPREPEILGRNFDLRKAVQAACLPILEKAREEHRDNERKKVELFKKFGQFLQEKFKDEFAAWLEAGMAHAADDRALGLPEDDNAGS